MRAVKGASGRSEPGLRLDPGFLPMGPSLAGTLDLKIRFPDISPAWPSVVLLWDQCGTRRGRMGLGHPTSAAWDLRGGFAMSNPGQGACRSCDDRPRRGARNRASHVFTAGNPKHEPPDPESLGPPAGIRIGWGCPGPGKSGTMGRRRRAAHGPRAPFRRDAVAAPRPGVPASEGGMAWRIRNGHGPVSGDSSGIWPWWSSWAWYSSLRSVCWSFA